MSNSKANRADWSCATGTVQKECKYAGVLSIKMACEILQGTQPPAL